MNSQQAVFEYNKVKLLNCIQSFFSMTPTRYYHDFHRYLDEIRPDYVNVDHAENLFTKIDGGIKFYVDNVHLQHSIHQDIQELPFSLHNSHLVEDLLYYLDNKSLKIYYRIFELEKRVRELENALENSNLVEDPHHLPRERLFTE